MLSQMHNGNGLLQCGQSGVASAAAVDFRLGLVWTSARYTPCGHALQQVSGFWPDGATCPARERFETPASPRRTLSTIERAGDAGCHHWNGNCRQCRAWALSKRYPVTVYDRELRPGGHSHTVTIDYDGTPVAVDIGFIVYNELNYPDLTALFAHLGIETVESCMSFAVTADAGRFEWKGGGNNWRETAGGLFAQPRNLLSPSYLWMLRDILTFNTQSIADHAAGRLAGLTLGEYFKRNHFAPRLLTDYLAPMGAAIWSAPAAEMLDFPAENFVAFFNNHRLLQYDRPVWRTVKGGSRRYVEKLTAAFRDQLRLGCAVTSIERTSQGVVVNDSHGRRDIYDHVVVASHSDQALAMLSDADDRERAVLGAIGYAPNAVYLHRDIRLMPKRRRAWASWNFLRWQREGSAENDVAVTYWMNRLQGLDEDKPLFVSLNPPFRTGSGADVRQIYLRSSAI